MEHELKKKLAEFLHELSVYCDHKLTPIDLKFWNEQLEGWTVATFETARKAFLAEFKGASFPKVGAFTPYKITKAVHHDQPKETEPERTPEQQAADAEAAKKFFAKYGHLVKRPEKQEV